MKSVADKLTDAINSVLEKEAENFKPDLDIDAVRSDLLATAIEIFEQTDGSDAARIKNAMKEVKRTVLTSFGAETEEVQRDSMYYKDAETGNPRDTTEENEWPADYL